MIVRFTRHATKHPTLSAIRDDGTTTWAEIPHGRYVHDLAHYAAETVLGWDDAFYGLLADGWDISTFNVPGAVKALDIPVRAQVMEAIVYCLETELIDFQKEEQFRDEVAAMCARGGHEPPAISDEQLAAMRARLRELLAAYKQVEAGASLDLPFPAEPST